MSSREAARRGRPETTQQGGSRGEDGIRQGEVEGKRASETIQKVERQP